MKKILKIGILSTIIVPIVTFAAGKDLKYIINLVLEYFNYAIFLTMGLAVVMFVWNVYKYFIAGGDDVGAKKDAGLYVLWSVVGFFVILSIWGLVNILTNTFVLENRAPSGFFPKFNGSNTNSLFNGQPTGGVNNSGGGTGGVNNSSGATGGVNNTPNTVNSSVRFDQTDSNLR